MSENKPKKMVLLASKGELDMAYPVFILASTGAAMDMEVTVFCTFYGLSLLDKDYNGKINPTANTAMPMNMPFGPKWFKNINWPMPNLLTGNIPFFNDFATSMMKKSMKNTNVASVQELRALSVEAGVRFIGCQMTMDVFGFKKEQFIDGVEIGGAAAFIEAAAESDVQFMI